MTDPPTPGPDPLRLAWLVLRCQAGDEAAFGRLYEWFGPRTLAYLRGLAGEDADDVQQEVWLTVYRQLGSLGDPRAFRTWLFRTTRHRAIDHLRRRRREQELFAEEEKAAEVPDRGASGDDRLDVDLVLELIGRLPALQREALLLRHRDDLSYAEIALVVGCSLGTVRSRLFQARRRLEQLMTSGGGAEPATGASLSGGDR